MFISIYQLLKPKKSVNEKFLNILFYLQEYFVPAKYAWSWSNNSWKEVIDKMVNSLQTEFKWLAKFTFAF